MGEIAEMMLDGTLCSVCGAALIYDEEEACGYSVTCSGCSDEG